MAKRPLYYFILIFIITFFFHKEQFGLNALISAIAFVGFSLFDSNKNQSDRNWRWYVATALLIGNGILVFVVHSPLSIGMYFLSFFYFAAIHENDRLSLPISIMQSIQSFFMGFYWAIASMLEHIGKKREGKQYHGLIRILLFTIPLIIGIIFLKLYQNADDTFREWTAFIRLDWISWSFIGLYVLFLILFFGFYFLRSAEALEKTEYRYKNGIRIDYTDKIQEFLTLKNERQIALSLLITLISLLLIYNAVDIRSIWVEMLNADENLSYSEIVHGGINSLITSIVLVILIITFLFRGGINFEKNRTTKVLTLIWLSLNVLMITTTVIKNHAYIGELGLTYKRIGVDIYLTLALGGLLLTFIKVLKKQSFWFLLRSSSLMFLVVFSVVGAFQWNKIIAQYNLEMTSKPLDLEYIFDLGPDTYPYLLDYYGAHQEQERSNLDFWQDLTNEFEYQKWKLEDKEETYSWKSMNLADYYLLQRMRKYNIIQPNQITENYEMDYR